MSHTRNDTQTWWDEELENRRRAELLKPAILNKFWEERIANLDTEYEGPIKGFLEGCPPVGMDKNRWAQILDSGKNEEYSEGFNQIIAKRDKEAFMHYFAHVDPIRILEIDKGEGFGLSKDIVYREVPVSLTSDDENTIKQYLEDAGISAVASISAQNNSSTICSSGNSPDSVYSIHSVGKILLVL